MPGELTTFSSCRTWYADVETGKSKLFVVAATAGAEPVARAATSAAARARRARRTASPTPSVDPSTLSVMRIAVASDERTGVAEAIVDELRRRGHEPVPHGALADGKRDDWAWASEAAARDVADGRADQAIVSCWTGIGASIAAN